MQDGESWEVRRLGRQDAPIFLRLMQEGYATAAGFHVKPPGLVMNPTDEFYITLGLFRNGELVSSMRTEWVLTQKELNLKLEQNHTLPPDQFPAVFLTKAATSPSFKNQGLNLILRFYSLKLAEQWKARYVFGTMVEGSPRIRSLEKMGYTFSHSAKKWDHIFVSNSIPLIAQLDLKTENSKAFAYIQEKVGVRLNACLLTTPLSSMRVSDQYPFPAPWL